MAMTQAKIETELRLAAERRDREIIKQLNVKAGAEAAIGEAQRQYGTDLEVILRAAGTEPLPPVAVDGAGTALIGALESAKAVVES